MGVLLLERLSLSNITYQINLITINQQSVNSRDQSLNRQKQSSSQGYIFIATLAQLIQRRASFSW